MKDEYVIFFDRDLGNIHGRFTLQRVSPDGKAIPVFKQLPAASGQYPYTDGGKEDWITGKGPIPFGPHWLSTKKEPLWMEPKGTPFYVISSIPGKRFITDGRGFSRGNIGLHLENRSPGSAGCIVLLHDTPQRSDTAWKVFKFLDNLYMQGIHHIKLVVL